MAVFRAAEAAERGFEAAKRYLVDKSFSSEEKEKALDTLNGLVSELGPVVDSYPLWHPLVRHHQASHAITLPGQMSGYEGLDHTVHFAHGFVTCPYAPSGKAEKVIASVQNLPSYDGAKVTAEYLDAPLYNTQTKPVLVRCEWDRQLDAGHMIPTRLAVGMMLEKELEGWQYTDLGETWEDMRPYFLGQPNGARSSLFVSQETAMAMKRVWNSVIESGMFGRVGRN